MQGNSQIAVSYCLEKADLLALKLYDPTQRKIDEKSGYQEKNRRQRAAHVVQHVEFVIEEGMGYLVLPTACGGPPVGFEQRIEPCSHLTFRGIAQQLDRDRGERPLQIVDSGQRALGHPEDPEPIIVWHQVARSNRINELGRKGDTDDSELLLATIEDC